MTSETDAENRKSTVPGDWLNYHHLLYFWTVAREGSITRACEKLLLAQPTISGQLRKLEETLGGKLFQRNGRNLVLTELGQMTFKFADEIFVIGQQLVDTVQGRATGRPMRLSVGLPGVLPKLIAYKLLSPVLSLPEGVQLICREASQDELLTMLAAHQLDVVFSDIPAGSLLRVKAFNHSLGRSAVGIYGSKALKEKYEGPFPECLEGANFVLPAETTTLRRTFDQWIYESGLNVNIIGEFDDTALMKVFAESGQGLVPLPTVIADELESKHGLFQVDLIPGGTEDFYAISVEKKISHPAVAMISEIARIKLFGNSDHNGYDVNSAHKADSYDTVAAHSTRINNSC